MIILFTDFGWHGPYVGQLKAVLQQLAPQIPVVDLMHDAPAFNPKASAYLLNALRQQFPSGSIFLAIVDPGVGATDRRAIIVEADNQWFIGPENGLFEIIVRTAQKVKCWEITWRPEKLSASFHGRDIFAPVVAMLARGDSIATLACVTIYREKPAWPTDLPEIIYNDHYGNAMTGVPASKIPDGSRITVAGQSLRFARSFAAVPSGQAFWYENSIGLIELAVNQGNFQNAFECVIGTRFDIE